MIPLRQIQSGNQNLWLAQIALYRNQRSFFFHLKILSFIRTFSWNQKRLVEIDYLESMANGTNEDNISPAPPDFAGLSQLPPSSLPQIRDRGNSEILPYALSPTSPMLPRPPIRPVNQQTGRSHTEYEAELLEKQMQFLQQMVLHII